MNGIGCCVRDNVLQAPVVFMIHPHALGVHEAAVPMRHFLQDRVVQISPNFTARFALEDGLNRF
jgi:hypothetical protein